eukprot:gnl/MRDRNA2_/MRDRNA2_30076_c0_seq1.p1 gnl/MRDRNA2_/MRDRNA2_30076_c0~~gnl/MRDRNA2_/MRDRNA2_30076_c0_seq1.p1  ORF type:complete len:1278 (+),score=218.76 gnl/MRDRNA2_/MRDRNA2_30076_c0_seq1:62-3895(+)
MADAAVKTNGKGGAYAGKAEAMDACKMTFAETSLGLSSAIVSAEETWNLWLREELPYFDERLICETCAQFVSTSCFARAKYTPNAPATCGFFLKIGNAHALSFVGAERFVLELVPRCLPFKQQLISDVVSLSAGSLEDDGNAIVEYEVARFFRSRLIVVDLSELLEYDCFKPECAEDDDLPRHSTTSRIRRHPNGLPLQDGEELYQDRLELVLERFESNFWQVLMKSLAHSLFGDKAPQLVGHFIASATETFRRYEGELQLALNSLMGKLPFWLSESLFFAFVHLSAGAAAKQPSEKYAMLHQCVKMLMHSSGRYVFLSTPCWYLPVVSWLRGLGSKVPKRPSAQQNLGLQTIWFSQCMDSDAMIQAVDDIWGGPAGKRRAHLKLVEGVEVLSRWVYRITMGTERLFSVAMRVLSRLAQVKEDMFGRLLDAEMIDSFELDRESIENAMELIMTDGGVSPGTPGEDEKNRLVPPKGAQLCLDPIHLEEEKEDSLRLKPSVRRTVAEGGGPCDVSLLNLDLASGGFSILDLLHADSQGPTASNEPKLRTYIASAEERGVLWPLGQDGVSQDSMFNGRIPIHDASELLPTAPPPPFEDLLNVQPSQLDLPARAAKKKETPSPAPTKSPKHMKDGSQAVMTAGENMKWHWEFYGVHVEDSKKISRTTSAPNLMTPEDFETTLKRMEMGPRKVQIENHAVGAQKVRPKTAPGSFDTSDFDVGDPFRNSAIALALQAEVRAALTCRGAGPLTVIWDLDQDAGLPAQYAKHAHCAALIMVALRAPFSTQDSMPFQYFAISGREGFLDTVSDTLDLRLPDGFYSLGLMPVLHTEKSEGSGRVAPSHARTFQVVVPHIFFEEDLLANALQRQSLWEEGTLLVLLMIAAVKEGFFMGPMDPVLIGRPPQDHLGLFSLICVFRCVLGLELMSIYRRVHNSTDFFLEDLMPILMDIETPARRLPLNFDMSASAKPMLAAPRLEQGPPSGQPVNFEEWPDSRFYAEASTITLGDMAAWVSQLAGDRVIYSSHRSQNSDLYLKLAGPEEGETSLVVICFHQPKRPMTGPECWNLYERAIGEPSWWKVTNIHFICLSTKLAPLLESACEGRTCKNFAEDDQMPQCKEKVKPGSEIIVCIPQCIFSILGPQLKEIIATHTKNFEAEMKEGEVWDTKRKTEKRVTKAMEPRPVQLESNFGALKELLRMIYTLDNDLLRLGEVDGSRPPKSADSDASRTSSRDKKRAQSPRGAEEGSSRQTVRKQKSKTEKGMSPRGQAPRREVVFNFMGLDQVK